MLSIEIYLHQGNESLKDTKLKEKQIKMIGINSITSITTKKMYDWFNRYNYVFLITRSCTKFQVVQVCTQLYFRSEIEKLSCTTLKINIHPLYYFYMFTYLISHIIESLIWLKCIRCMFSKNIVDKHINKHLKYKVEHKNLQDSVIITKKTLKF